MLRYRVGLGLRFHVDRSPSTGGVWLDAGEWEALKGHGLHVHLHLVFTASYQRAIRSEEYRGAMEQVFRERIGEADFPRVSEFKRWLDDHPRRREIGCYLLGDLGAEQ